MTSKISQLDLYFGFDTCLLCCTEIGLKRLVITRKVLFNIEVNQFRLLKGFSSSSSSSFLIYFNVHCKKISSKLKNTLSEGH